MELTPAVRALYPFSPRAFQAPSGRMSFLDEGPRSARPVLLLHGNPSWSFLWRDLVAELVARGRRVIVPDHVGMGLSGRPGAFLRLNDRIRDVEALLDSLGLTGFDLGVHDWGGAIGFGLAVRRPSRVGRILVTNTAAFRSRRIPMRIALCRTPLLGRLLVQGLNAFAGPAASMAVERPLAPAVREGFLLPYRTWASRRSVADFVADIPLERHHPSWAALDEIERGLPSLAEKPMLLCWGMRDFCFDRHFLDGFRRRFPSARELIFEAAGHYVLEDAGRSAIEPAAGFLTPS